MQATTVGIDLAKNIFHVHGVDAAGHIVFSKPLRRAQMAEFFATLPACLIGMEACASAHFWARTLQGFGHTVRLISPQFVKPYVKSNKNDRADAQAICDKAKACFDARKAWMDKWNEHNPKHEIALEQAANQVKNRGSMPFCVELDNLKDTDAPIHQPAAMLVAAD